MRQDKAIATLLAYAEKYLMLSPRDGIYARNRVMDALGLISYGGAEAGVVPELPDGLLAELFSALEEAETPFDRATLGEKIMDAVMIRPSEYEAEFARRYARSPREATDWAYAYAVHSDYVKKSAIDKNIKWGAKNGLEITINLSKPEKNNADLKKQLAVPSTSYPKCTICRENEGFERPGFSRRNMRTLSLTLGGEPWFWQYSPYAYFNEHGIAIACRHSPMQLEEGTAGRLFDFVESFPHYFIGNNAPLPRVGGSILAHDHYQGGCALLPMQRAGVRIPLLSQKHPSVSAGVLDWYNSALRLEGENRAEIEALAWEIACAWKNYQNAAAEIVPYTGDEPHNTASFIARKKDGGYILDVILRNNRTSAEHPGGIFHAHAEYHAVKSESIGLIEAMGLFILPARLKRQLAEVKKFLTGEISSLAGDTVIFAEIAERLKAGGACGEAEAEQKIKAEIERVCTCILGNTAVFKRDAAGERGWEEFLAQAGLEKKGDRI